MATRQHKLPASARTICGQAGKKMLTITMLNLEMSFIILDVF